MNRRTFLGVAASGGAAAVAQPGGQPNFLILLSDQHSPHVLGCYGDRVVQTPNLDRLASRGVLFEHAYCQAPLCVPSRMSFLTGLQPSQSRVWTNSDTLPSDIPTFAHALGAAGYQTALIGRMHFNGPDQRHGFDQRLVGDVTPAFPDRGIPLTPQLLPGATNSSRLSVSIAGPGKTAYQVFDEDVTKATVDYLRGAASTKRPFCAVSGFVLPHSPFVCPESFWRYYYDRVTAPPLPPGYLAALHPAIQTWRKARGVDDLTTEEIRRARAGYYGLVAQFDGMVGRILEALRESGMENDTVVVYTSDHGEMAGENGMWWKMNFYEGSVTVPLIVASSRFRPARRASETVSLVDIAPTLCELAGAPQVQGSGKSLVPVLSGTATAPPTDALSELAPMGPVPATRMIRRGKWKLVHFHGMRPQLFDLERDPREQHDLGESAEFRAVRDELTAAVMRDWKPEEISRELAVRQSQRTILAKWAEQTHPPSDPVWQAPPDANIFPLERAPTRD